MSENSSIYLNILEKLRENKNLILNDILKFIFSDCINLNDNLNFISFIFQVYLSKIDLTFKEIWNVIKTINLIRKSNLFEKKNQGIIFILNLYKICIKLLTEKINFLIPSKNFDDFKEIIIIIEIISSYDSLFICDDFENYKNEIEIINEYIEILFKNIEILAKEKNNKILLNLLNINNFNKNKNNFFNKEENSNENKNKINFNNNLNNNKSFDSNKKNDFSRNKKGNIFNVHTNYNNINIISQNKNNNLNKTYTYSKNYKKNNKSFSHNKSFTKNFNYFYNKNSHNNSNNFNNHKKNYFNSNIKSEEITINSIKNSNNIEINKKNNNDNNINKENIDIKKIKKLELINKFTEELNMQIYYFSDYSIEINKILNLNLFINEFKKVKPNLKIIRFGSFNCCTLSPYKKDCIIDLMICEKGKKSEFSHLYEITQRIKNFKKYSINFNINKEQKFFDLKNNCVSFILNHNYKDIIVHLYLNNDIFRFTSLLIKKIYMNCKNILYLHYIVSEELIIELKLFNSNFELSILILNFFQYYFKIFLIEEKKYNNFSYFSLLKKDEKISYNSNIIKKISEKFIIEFDEKVYDLINKNYLKIIKIKFFEFIYFYFNWIFSSQNNSNNKIFNDEYFSQKDFILSRTFIDNKLSNSFKNDEKLLRNNISQLIKKINNLKSNK